MSESILKGVIKCVADGFAIDASELTIKTKLITDLDADSLDIMDLMFQLEEVFDIKLEKDDFNFLTKIDMPREKAVVDDLLTTEAKESLKEYLPDLEIEKELRPSDLSQYLSLASLVKLVQEHQAA